MKKHGSDNPAQILDCSKPQERLQMNKDNYYPQFYSYKQCLPICNIDKSNTTVLAIKHTSGFKEKVKVVNNISCSPKSGAVSNGNKSPGKFYV